MSEYQVTKWEDEQAETLVWTGNLFRKGCGAIVGRQGCKCTPQPVLLEINLPFTFLLYRSVERVDGHWYAFLCEKHNGSIERATADAAPGLVKQQYKEMAICFRRNKITPHAPGLLAMYDVFGTGEAIVELPGANL